MKQSNLRQDQTRHFIKENKLIFFLIKIFFYFWIKQKKNKLKIEELEHKKARNVLYRDKKWFIFVEKRHLMHVALHLQINNKKNQNNGNVIKRQRVFNCISWFPKDRKFFFLLIWTFIFFIEFKAQDEKSSIYKVKKTITIRANAI